MGIIKNSLSKELSRNSRMAEYIANGWWEGSFWDHEGVEKIFQENEDDDKVWVCIDFNKKSAQVYVETFYSSHRYDEILDLKHLNLENYEEVIEFLDFNI